MYKIYTVEMFRKILPIRNELLLGGKWGFMFVFDISKARITHRWQI